MSVLIFFFRMDRICKNLSDTRSSPKLEKYCYLPSKFCLAVCFLAKKRLEIGIILNFHDFVGGYL